MNEIHFKHGLNLCLLFRYRYEWNGSPLFNCVPSVDVPRRCSQCNSETVFELQLTPALVNHLKVRADVEDDSSEGIVLAECCTILTLLSALDFHFGDVSDID